MPCLIGCLALAAPRIALLLVVLFSDYIERAFPNFIWPLLGFLFMPLTTLAYAFGHVQNSGQITGIYFVLVAIAVLMDLSALGGGGWGAKRKYRTPPR